MSEVHRKGFTEEQVNQSRPFSTEREPVAVKPNLPANP